MSYVQPAELAQNMIAAGESKALMSTRDTLIRSFMGGALLTMAAAFAVTVSTQTGNALVGAMLFPVGFVLLYLLGYDLLTGVFTLVPLAWIAKRPGVNFGAVMRNWGLVFLGNFPGAFFVGLAIYATHGRTAPKRVPLLTACGKRFAASPAKVAKLASSDQANLAPAVQHHATQHQAAQHQPVRQ